jgi:dienelactone hydrolase
VKHRPQVSDRHAVRRVACIALIAIWTVGASTVRAQTVAPPGPDPQPDPKLNEEIVKLPLTLKLPSGAMQVGEFVLTTFRPDGPGPFPAVIMSHGREARRRAVFGRNRILAAFWTRRGFAVLAPTRIGHGVSGAAVDPEAVSGQCEAWTFEAMASAIRAHIRATVEYAAKQPWIDKDNLVLAGGSAGGAGSVLAGADRLPGVKAVVNFAGGFGGRKGDRILPSCNPKSVEQMMAAAGNNNAIPSIWFYSENDGRYGPQVPRNWHAAYVGAGGNAEMHVFPPLDDDGHNMIGLGGERWRPLLDRFLVANGFTPRKPPPDAPAPSGFASLEDIPTVSRISQRCREIYADFLKKDVPRAFAIGPGGNCAYFAGQPDVVAKSLVRCKEAAKQACKLYTVNDDVVWQP